MQPTGMPLIGNRPNMNNNMMNRAPLNGAPQVTPGGGPGIVGNYPSNNYQSRASQQQSIMGMGSMNQIRQPNQNSNQFNNGVYSTNRANLGQHGSIMGSRPPLVPNQPNGLMPMRPGMNPNIPQSNNSNMSLLNNPRMPQSMQPNSLNQRNDWDSRNPSMSSSYNTVNGPSGPGMNMLSSNPMMMMSNQAQNQRNQLPTTQGNPIQQFNYGNGPNNPQMGPQTQNGLLNQPQMSHPYQTQQPGGFQSGYAPNGQPTAAQMLGQNVGMNSMQMQPTQTHLQSQPGSIHSHQQQPHLQDQYYRQSSLDHANPSSQIMPPHLSQSSSSALKMSDMEFQEALEKNRIVQSSAINRAVQDASIGRIFDLINEN